MISQTMVKYSGARKVYRKTIKKSLLQNIKEIACNWTFERSSAEEKHYQILEGSILAQEALFRSKHIQIKKNQSLKQNMQESRDWKTKSNSSLKINISNLVSMKNIHIVTCLQEFSSWNKFSPLKSSYRNFFILLP